MQLCIVSLPIAVHFKAYFYASKGWDKELLEIEYVTLRRLRGILENHRSDDPDY
jgi:hypothetical protein